MKYRLLGPTEVLDGDSDLKIERVKIRRLLAVLLVHVNSVVSTDCLVEQLWDGRPPRGATGTLQTYVSRLRKVVGSESLRRRPPGYELTVAPEDVDICQFRRLVGQGHTATRMQRPRQAVALLRDALALWRGQALAEFADESWASATVADLDELRTSAYEECLGAEVELGRHVEVVAELERLTLENPLRERLWAHLMLALYRSGRQADAVEAYDKLSAHLTEDLHTRPDRAVRALRHAILNQDPSLVWTPPNPLPAQLLGPRPPRRFIGRTDNLAQLLGRWRSARDGVPGLVVVAGEAGVGKTRLAEQLCRAAHAEGATIMWGRTSRTNAPYGPVASALRDYTERMSPDAVAEMTGPSVAHLSGLIPGLGGQEAQEGAPRERTARRDRMFEAVAGLLRAAGAAGPLLLILEDLHWADRSTLLLLDYLVRHPGPAPGMLLATCRDGALSTGHPLWTPLAELDADGFIHRLRLTGLDEDDVAQLMEAITGHCPSASVTRAIYERTTGNPLFVEEIARALDTGTAEDVRQLPVPDRIKSVFAQRLGRLAPQSLKVLRTAAVLRRDFGIGALAAMLGRPRAAVLEVIEDLVDADIIVEEPTAPGRFAFTHPLMQDTVYESLTVARRAWLHNRAANVLDSIDSLDEPASLAALADHYRQATIDNANRAIEYDTRAGDEAITLLGFSEARSHYQQALDLLWFADPADRGRRLRLLLSLGRVQLCEYDAATARRTYLEAAELAIDADAPDDLAAAAFGIMASIEFAEIDESAVVMLRRALAGIDHNDTPLRAKLLASLARALPGSDPHVTVLVRQAEAAAQRVGEPDTIAFVYSATLPATWAPDNTRERLAAATDLIRLGDELGWAELSMEARNWRSAALDELADTDAADRDLDELVARAQRSQRPFYLATAAMRRAARALARGDYANTERHTSEMIALGGDSRNFQSGYGAQMFAMRRDQGRLSEVVDMVAGYVAQSQLPAWRAAQALLQLELGDHGGAARGLDDLVRDHCAAIPRDWLWLCTVGHLSDVCVGLGDADHAGPLIDLLRPYARRTIVLAHGVLSTGAAARNLGQLATALGRFDDAEQHFRTAIEIDTRSQAHPSLVRVYLAYADLLRRRSGAGDLVHATRLTAAADAIAGGLGMDTTPCRPR